MVQVTLILSAIYISIIIYVFVHFNLDARPSEKHELYRDELELLPTESAYLLNKNVNSMNLLLADILSLVNMGYVNMELINIDENNRDYKFTKVEDKDTSWLKNHQVLAYRMFFNDSDSLTLNEFLENVKYDNDYNREAEIKYHAIKLALDNEFEKEELLNVEAKRTLFKINSSALHLIFIFIFALVISSVYAMTEGPRIFIPIITLLLFSIILYFSTNSTEIKLTQYGADLKEKASGTFNYLQEYVLVEDKPLYMVNVLEYYYVFAIAMELVDMVNKKYKCIRCKIEN